LRAGPLVKRREFCKTALIGGSLIAVPAVGVLSSGAESRAKEYSDTPGVTPSGDPTSSLRPPSGTSQPVFAAASLPLAIPTTITLGGSGT